MPTQASDHVADYPNAVVLWGNEGAHRVIVTAPRELDVVEIAWTVAEVSVITTG